WYGAKGCDAEGNEPQVDDRPDPEYVAGRSKARGVQGRQLARVETAEGDDVGGGVDGQYYDRRQQGEFGSIHNATP
ncbi:MAG: hypothetical protein ACK559_10575, partial [bacterium]